MLPFLLGDQPMPHSAEIETAVLSCLLQDPQSVSESLALPSEAFYTPINRIVYEAICQVSKKSPLFDIIEISEHMERTGRLEDIGGIPKLREIYSKVPTIIGYEKYLGTINDYYLRRKLIGICTDAIGCGFEQITPTFELISNLDSSLIRIADSSTSDRPEPVCDVTQLAIEKLRGIYERDPEALGIPTGYSRVDSIIGGLRKGEIIVIAARPSIGKTAFVVCTVRNVAACGYPAVLFGLEMRNAELTTRMISAQSRISKADLLSGRMPWSEYEARLNEAKYVLDKLPLYLDHAGGCYEEIAHRIRVLVKKKGIRVVAVDYLQLIRMRDKSKHLTREQEVATMSSGFKKLAQDLDIAIILLAQLNREAEGKQPKISDLRESGAVEQDADVIGLLNRKRETDNDDMAELLRQGKPLPAEILWAKNRNGKTGISDLEWWRDFTMFSDKPRIADEDVPV